MDWMTLMMAVAPTLLLGFYGIVRFIAGRWAVKADQERELQKEAEKEAYNATVKLVDQERELGKKDIKIMILEREIETCRAELRERARGNHRGRNEGQEERKEDPLGGAR